MVSILGSGSSSDSSAVSSRSSSPTGAITPNVAAVNPLNPKGVKPCCACPETKEKRDQCFLTASPEEAGEKCRAMVEAHRDCMASYGFKI